MIDILQLAAMSPAQRRQFLIAKFGQVRQPIVPAPNATNQELLDPVEPLSGKTYFGYIRRLSSDFFELVHDDGSISVHYTHRSGMQTFHPICLNQQYHIVYEGMSVSIWPRERCRCGIFLSESNHYARYQCHACKKHCLWCEGIAQTVLYGQSICFTCEKKVEQAKDFLEVLRKMLKNPLLRRISRSTPWLCAWCVERPFVEAITIGDRAYQFYIERIQFPVCEECRQNVSSFIFPLPIFEKRDKRQDALHHLRCEQCYHGDVSWFTEDRFGWSQLYLCDQCCIRTEHPQLSIPVFSYKGKLLEV